MTKKSKVYDITRLLSIKHEELTLKDLLAIEKMILELADKKNSKDKSKVNKINVLI